jgi:hypothetical protein
MHGEAVDGNEPFIMLYNPALHPPKAPVWYLQILYLIWKIKIDVIDVAPTLSFYFDGADIPANSLGQTHVYWGIYYAN